MTILLQGLRTLKNPFMSWCNCLQISCTADMGMNVLHRFKTCMNHLKAFAKMSLSALRGDIFIHF